MAFASPEFIALCQSQVLLLTQSLGAGSTVVYLAEQAEHGGGLSLVPLVAYPEAAKTWAELPDTLTTPASPAQGDGTAPDWAEDSPTPSGAGRGRDLRPSMRPTPLAETSSGAVVPPLVRPLMHEGVALGMLVSHRPALAWSREDYQRAEQVANTLALAWILDQRGQWFQQQFQQRHLTQASQSETFHDLLHQFRNPLTALQTFGRLLVKRIPQDDPNQPIAEGILREGQRLQELAQTFDDALAQGDDLLQAEDEATPWQRGQLPPAAAPSGRLLPKPAAEEQTHLLPENLGDPANTDAAAEPVLGPETYRWGRPLQRVAGTWDDQVRPLLQSATVIAQERGLYLVEELPPQLPAVWMDPKALAEVLSNVLDNALKYAPAGAMVWVMGGLSQTVAGQLWQGLAVGDTGPGIPAADQPRIFERHFRGVRASGDIPGTGLGLAIAKELMEDMGGRLDLISPVPPTYQRALSQWCDAANSCLGPGTCFIVWLPQLEEF